MQKVTKSSRISLVRGWKFWNKPQQVCTTTTPRQCGKQMVKQVAAFLRRYITFLQDMHSLVRRSRDRLLYPNKFLANSSGLWTSHELSGFQTLLDVRESEMSSLEIFGAPWIKVLTPSAVLHTSAQQWKPLSSPAVCSQEPQWAPFTACQYFADWAALPAATGHGALAHLHRRGAFSYPFRNAAKIF